MALITSDWEAPVLDIWENVEYHFIVHTPRFTQMQSDSTNYNPIYRSNKYKYKYKYRYRSNKYKYRSNRSNK